MLSSEVNNMKRAITVTFPAPLPATIKCPICEGNKCRVCKMSGKIDVKVDAKVPIQRGHIIKYIADNLKEVSAELTKTYGLTPEVNTVGVHDTGEGNYEIVQFSSIGGACWVVFRLDDLENPMYFFSRQKLDRWKQGGFE